MDSATCRGRFSPFRLLPRADKEGDFRFTTKGAAVYAIALEWPEDPTFTLTTLAGRKVQSVELLGHGPLKFSETPRGLTITMPEKRPCKFAYTFKIR